jgi:hypothetical protein
MVVRALLCPFMRIGDGVDGGWGIKRCLEVKLSHGDTIYDLEEKKKLFPLF